MWSWIRKRQPSTRELLFRIIPKVELVPVTVPEKYDAVAELFRSRGFRMSECRIKNALAMSRDAESGSNYLRSTICFPEKTVRDLNPQLIDLFKEVIGYEEREKTQAEGTVPV